MGFLILAFEFSVSCVVFEFCVFEFSVKRGFYFTALHHINILSQYCLRSLSAN